MHIIYFHQHFSTPAGATGTRSYEMAKKLMERGHQVTMVCGSYGVGKTGLEQDYVNGRREGQVDGIQVIEFELPYSNKDSFVKRSWTFLKFAFNSVKLALTMEYDLLFSTSTPLTAGIPGIITKLMGRKKPFVFEVRDLWPELPKAMGVISNPVILTLMSWLEWLSYNLADGCIGLAPGIVDGIKARMRGPSRVALVPNGCDLSMFHDQKRDDGWRPDGVAAGELMAVFTGAHGMANGLDAVLDAAQCLKERGRGDIKLVFVGEGKMKSALKDRAVRQGLDNCIFLDAVPKPRLAGLLTEADLGLMILANVPAFYYGTSPNKFFDYISTGLPVLNNYPGWLAGMIKEHGCGLAVEPDDPHAFAEALIQADGNRQQLLDMGKKGRELACQQFDRQMLASQLVDELEQVALDYEKAI